MYYTFQENIGNVATQETMPPTYSCLMIQRSEHASCQYARPRNGRSTEYDTLTLANLRSWVLINTSFSSRSQYYEYACNVRSPIKNTLEKPRKYTRRTSRAGYYIWPIYIYEANLINRQHCFRRSNQSRVINLAERSHLSGYFLIHREWRLSCRTQNQNSVLNKIPSSSKNECLIRQQHFSTYMLLLCYCYLSCRCVKNYVDSC